MHHDLSSFGNDLNVAIVGASGGIGRALAVQLSEYSQVSNIYCFSRSKITPPSPKSTCTDMDITDENSIAQALCSLDGVVLDIVIVATGLLHSEHVTPEKSLRNINFDQLNSVFAVNTFGPIVLAKHILPRMRKDRKSVFAALSARVGSISDNRLGGWYAYRASKAALNMMLKNAAIETGRRNKHACILGLHPGTVNTGLSKPFQTNVKEGKLFDATFSAQKLLAVIDNVTPEQSGELFAWDGKNIAF